MTGNETNGKQNRNRNMTTHTRYLYLILLVVGVMLVGTVSADVLTVYAPADIADGKIGNSTIAGLESFYEQRAMPGNIATLTAANGSAISLATKITTGNFTTLQGFAWSGNTSDIPDDATIDSAIFGLYADGVKSQDYTPMNATIVPFYPANPESLVASDWDTRNTDLKYSSPIEYADWDLEAYNNFTITNLSSINKTGYTSLLATTGYDAYNWSPVAAGQKSSKFGIYDNSVGKKAFLEITYHDAETDPPESITGLSNTTFCSGATFSWVNPSDADYHHAYTLKDGVANGNISTPTATVTWTGLSVAEHTISIQTVDNSGNINATMVNQTVDITATCPVSMGSLVNNATNLSISTYDGSGQLVHPNVVYSAAGWNGYNYLMVMSPYPGADSTKENPSMRYSTDKVTWEQIAGQPDPIIGEPATGFNSDPNIYLNGSTLYLFNRYADSETPTDVHYNRTTTTDGVTWTAQEQLTFPYFVRSASFLYNGTGWESWAFKVSDGNLYHFTSSADGLTFAEYGTITGVSTNLWHGEVKYYDKQFQFLASYDSYAGLYYYNSTNGLAWVPSESNPVLEEGTAGMWDRYLYKSSFIESGGVYEVFYGATTNASGTWRVGYSDYPNNGYPTVASFTANTTSGLVPLGVAFTDTSTNTPTMWNYSWGDGNWTNGTASTAEHLYEYVGLFDSFLIASNAAGSNQSANITINVSAIPPPVAAFSGNVTSGTVPFTVNFTDESTGTPTNWDWYMAADETKTSDDQNPEVAFITAGSYDIRLWVSNANGGSWSNQTGYITANDPGTPVTPSPGSDYAVDNSIIIGIMLILGICPMLAGVGLAVYAFSTYEPDYMYLLAGIVAIAIGVIVIVVIIMLMPVFAGAAESVL